MQPLARNGYASAQVRAALVSGNRQMSFRYELLDSANAHKGYLTDVLGATVTVDSEAEIKRTASIQLREDGSIDYLSDRIKPWVRLLMPDGGYAEFPQGVFLPATPPRESDAAGVIQRKVEAYDQGLVLVEDRVGVRYVVAAGTNYIAAVKAVLDGAGLTMQNLQATAETLPAARDWAIGTTKLRIVNDLLAAINYLPLWFDENGRATAQAYLSPDSRAPEYAYATNDESVILPGVKNSLDTFAVPNRWIVVVSEPDRAPLIATYTNTNPSSRTSTVSRGRTIVDFREGVEGSGQTVLEALVERMAFEASQVYEEVELSTMLMPMHSHLDVVTLRHTALSISAKFSELSWSMELKAGGSMRHQLRRVVSI